MNEEIANQILAEIKDIKINLKSVKGEVSTLKAEFISVKEDVSTLKGSEKDH
ncbi:hypothetical protein ACUL41_14095 [Virgibacillus natechei]|uniref:hypothetical protein n=1 Tax=Virgibacillus sp. CBA3643 TaxID=2942278 RepID=UPI0035A2FD1D